MTGEEAVRGETGRGKLRLEPGPHPTKRKRKFLANYGGRIRGFADRLAGTRGTGGRFYILGWTRAAKMLKETPGATT